MTMTVLLRDASYRGATQAKPIAELARVKLLLDVQNEHDRTVPAGSEGTVAIVYGGGVAFEIDFEQPEGLATVPAADLIEVEPAPT
jgi:hypothetical protein